MQELNLKLPEYPCKADMWDKLAEETRPILIYGMGNGADKLIDRFQKLNISFADIFASDGFVRGHSFHGIRVKSFSEVKAMYPEFVIVLSFASNRPEVISMLREIDSEYDMYIPDMPIAGEEYFDREFYNANYEKIKEAYNLLSDSLSKRLYSSVVNYKLFGKMELLLEAFSEKPELYSFVSEKKSIKSYIDCGAYNGDTLKEALSYFRELEFALAIEPDPKNYKRLLKYTESLNDTRIKALNSAVWSECRGGDFKSSGNRNSTVSATASYEYKITGIPLVSLDSLELSSADFIKYDVEGAELEALIGSEGLIEKERPVLLVSAYHRSEDVFSLLLYLREKHPSYTFYMRRILCVPAWELDLIAVPIEI